MPEILTTNFKTDNTRRFVDDVLTNDYYVFVSGTELSVSENSIRAKTTFLEGTLFGKKIADSDVKFMIKYLLMALEFKAFVDYCKIYANEDECEDEDEDSGKSEDERHEGKEDDGYEGKECDSRNRSK